MKMFNSGPGYTESALHGIPTVKRPDSDGEIREHVQVPLLFTGGKIDYVKHEPGQAYVPLHGHGFFVVPLGKSFDVPSGVSAATVKSIAPHLVTEEEHLISEKQKAAQAEQKALSKKKD